MAAPDLQTPEHPIFPREAAHLQDPHRAPTDRERHILEVFMRFKELPDFSKLDPATPDQKAEAISRLDKLRAQPPDPIEDQDSRILNLAEIISDYPAVFGNLGYYIAAEIMGGTKTIETSEFRRAFFREYLPALPGLRAYLKRLAALRRRASSSVRRPSEVPSEAWGNATRRAAAREQMELVQNLPDSSVMEKYWRTLEIVSAYPDIFTREQFDKLKNHPGIEQSWKAHLVKARDDLNYYNNLLRTAKMMRDLVDSAIIVLKEIAAKA